MNFQDFCREGLNSIDDPDLRGSGRRKIWLGKMTVHFIKCIGLKVPSVSVQATVYSPLSGQNETIFVPIGFNLCISEKPVVYWWSPSPDDILAQDWDIS